MFTPATGPRKSPQAEGRTGRICLRMAQYDVAACRDGAPVQEVRLAPQQAADRQEKPWRRTSTNWLPESLVQFICVGEMRAQLTRELVWRISEVIEIWTLLGSL